MVSDPITVQANSVILGKSLPLRGGSACLSVVMVGRGGKWIKLTFYPI